MRLFVANFRYETKSDDLRRAFDPFGAVVNVTVVMDRETGKSRGFGFVEMAQDAEGQQAIAALDGSTFDGRPLRVSAARPREERGQRR